jgi:putative SOS response-associated peptidase YedK
MCGRFTSTTPPSVLAESFAVDELRLDDDLVPRWNVAPTLPVLAVAESRRTGARRLGTFRWGLVPRWAESPSVGSRMINARAETVATKPAYRDALVRRRCIVPADAFYEWKVIDGRPKQPYAIARADGAPLAFAGLWDLWRDPNAPAGESEPLRTCVILTTAANERLAAIHHRMPVVLPPGVWDRWLDPANEDVDDLLGLLVPAPAADFVTWPVRLLGNKATNEGPELLEPIDDDEQATLAAGVAAGDGLQLDLLGPLVED